MLDVGLLRYRELPTATCLMPDQKPSNSELLLASNFFMSIIVAAVVGMSVLVPDRVVDRQTVGPGGAGDLARLVLVGSPLLGIMSSIGYGVLSIVAWMRARDSLPRMSIALAWINLLVLAVATSNAFSSGRTVPQCAGFVGLAVISLTVCLSLRLRSIGESVEPPGQPN